MPQASKLIEFTTRKRILLVEDSEPDKVLIEKTVRDLLPGADIVPVSSLAEAYETCKTNSFHLVLLDLNLPDGHGSATVQEMRRFNKAIPIVVLTGARVDLSRERALKNGADDYASKAGLLEADFRHTLERNIL